MERHGRDRIHEGRGNQSPLVPAAALRDFVTFVRVGGCAAWPGAVAVAYQVRDQDVDIDAGTPMLRRGVAEAWRISVEDPDMRHGRRSRSRLFDGYKRDVLRDLDTGLVAAVGITDDIAADLTDRPDLRALAMVVLACLS
ncbi:hypothetical protein GCM10010399_24130 [Dactylosporangium fulvum]